MMNRNLDALQLSGIRAYTNLAKEVEDCVLLTLGEPDFDTPEAIKAAAEADTIEQAFVAIVKGAVQ